MNTTGVRSVALARSACSASDAVSGAAGATDMRPPGAGCRPTLTERRGRDACLAVDGGNPHGDLVGVAPRPVLARLERTEDVVPGRAGMLGGAPSGGGVAAADVAATQADAQ